MSFVESKNQFYAPYWEWEDYQNGMYKATNGGNLEEGLKLFTNNDLCYNAMKQVTIEWVISTKVNLTNCHCNRKAWLGQAACCLYAGLTQQETCEVWKMLNDNERENANNIAIKVIKEWENKK